MKPPTATVNGAETPGENGNGTEAGGGTTTAHRLWNPAIHSVGYMLGSPNDQTQDDAGRWCRAVPLPYPGGIAEQLGAAWAVLTGRAVAVRWPVAGEIEHGLGMVPVSPPRPTVEGMGG